MRRVRKLIFIRVIAQLHSPVSVNIRSVDRLEDLFANIHREYECNFFFWSPGIPADHNVFQVALHVENFRVTRDVTWQKEDPELTAFCENYR